MWSRNFVATAVARGYKEVLEPSNPHTVADSDKSGNDYSDLMLSINDKTSFGIVDEAKSGDRPEDDPKLVWKELKSKFEPTTGFSEVELKRDFNACFLSDGEDPDT